MVAEATETEEGAKGAEPAEEVERAEGAGKAAEGEGVEAKSLAARPQPERTSRGRTKGTEGAEPAGEETETKGAEGEAEPAAVSQTPIKGDLRRRTQRQKGEGDRTRTRERAAEGGEGERQRPREGEGPAKAGEPNAYRPVGIAIFLRNGPSERSPDGSEEEAGTEEPAAELVKVPEGTTGRANGSTAAAAGFSSSG